MWFRLFVQALLKLEVLGAVDINVDDPETTIAMKLYNEVDFASVCELVKNFAIKTTDRHGAHILQARFATGQLVDIELR